eukprot:746235-Hanusia_phi.AAC.1
MYGQPFTLPRRDRPLGISGTPLCLLSPPSQPSSAPAAEGLTKETLHARSRTLGSSRSSFFLSSAFFLAAALQEASHYIVIYHSRLLTLSMASIILSISTSPLSRSSTSF